MNINFFLPAIKVLFPLNQEKWADTCNLNFRVYSRTSTAFDLISIFICDVKGRLVNIYLTVII